FGRGNLGRSSGFGLGLGGGSSLGGFAALGLLVAGVIGLHELDEGHFAGVAEAGAELVDAGVAAVAVGELAVLFIEKQRDRILVADVGQGQATQMNRVLGLGFGRGFLGLGDDLLDEGTQGLGLAQRGLDATVRDQRGAHVG